MSALWKSKLQRWMTPSGPKPDPGSAGRADLADRHSFFEFRFPFAPITHGNRTGGTGTPSKLAQTTIKNALILMHRQLLLALAHSGSLTAESRLPAKLSFDYGPDTAASPPDPRVRR